MSPTERLVLKVWDYCGTQMRMPYDAEARCMMVAGRTGLTEARVQQIMRRCYRLYAGVVLI